MTRMRKGQQREPDPVLRACKETARNRGGLEISDDGSHLRYNRVNAYFLAILASRANPGTNRRYLLIRWATQHAVKLAEALNDIRIIRWDLWAVGPAVAILRNCKSSAWRRIYQSRLAMANGARKDANPFDCGRAKGQSPLLPYGKVTDDQDGLARRAPGGLSR